METEKKIPVYQSKKTINALEIDKVVLDKETASKEKSEASSDDQDAPVKKTRRKRTPKPKPEEHAADTA